MSTMFDPAEAAAPVPVTARTLLLLLASAGCLLAAPLLLPPGYRWVAQSTSESAAQGLQGAWLARLGFLLLGTAVLALSRDLRGTWAAGAVWMHAAFGHLMVATAVFSHRPWLAGQPFDLFEDWLHSLTATAMGFAFAFGVLARMLQRRRIGQRQQVLDSVALAASLILPLAMQAFPTILGLLQRLLFFLAFLWYGLEALRPDSRVASNRTGSPGPDKSHGQVQTA